MRKSSLGRNLRYIARTVLCVVTLFWFGFAIFSGADGGVENLFSNLPNTLPWLGLLVVNFIAFRWDLLGGVFVLVVGIVSVFFFNAWSSPVVLFGVSLPVIIAGAALIACNRLDPPDHNA
ncbi:DUF7670 domain-containing protein [Sulfitobacter sp. MF3-043]|uniref:DUF7670 domain-containing protein n=1 Tax=Sulfitobacter sediminivivens TaxID=3252902 RepID=UPI0036DCECEF